MCHEMKTQKQKEKYKEWRCDAFTKWNILQINHLLNANFRKLLFLDADKIVLKNIDHLFTDSSILCPAGTFSSPWTNKRNATGLIDYYPKGIKQGDQIPAKSIHNALYKNGFVAVGTGLLFEPNINEYNKFVKMLDLRWICDEYMDNNLDKEKIKLRRLNNKFKVITDNDKPTSTLNVKTDDIVQEQKNVENDENIDKNAKTTSDFPEETEDKEQTEQITQSQKEDEKKDDNTMDDNDPYKKLQIMEKGEKWVIGFRNCYSMLDEQSIVFFYYYHKKPWYYIDVKYNFIPWHFKWLENDDGTLETPYILHFFGMKPWALSPLEWKDLQSWWSLVFNLLIWSNEEIYGWDQKQTDLVANFFDVDKLNQLPLKEYEKPKTDQDAQDVDVDGGDVDGGDNNVDGGNDNENDKESEKKLKSRVTCFWCYELAKRKGEDPENLIKTGETERIKEVFHFPIHPTTGKLCCPQLLNESTNPNQDDVTAHETNEHPANENGNKEQNQTDDEDDDLEDDDLKHDNSALKNINPLSVNNTNSNNHLDSIIPSNTTEN